MKKNISSRDIFEAICYLKKEIWNTANVQLAIEEIKNRPEDTLYYWPAPHLESVDNFLGKVGILGYKTLITDPLSKLCNINPNFEDAPHKKPDSYLKFLFEYTLFIKSLTKWIETGQVLLLPDLAMWDYSAWKDLAKMNEHIFEEHKLEDTEVAKRLYKVGIFEQGVELLSENIRLRGQNSSLKSIQKTLGLEDKAKATELLEDLKSMSKQDREIEAAKFLAGEYSLSGEVLKDKIEEIKKRQAFKVDNYFDISKLKEGLIITPGMSLTMSLYIENELNAISVTDNLANKLSVELFSQAIKLDEEQVAKKEFTQSKIDLSVPFLIGLSPDFIAEKREDTIALRNFLSERWEQLRKLNKYDNYQSLVRQFNDSIKREYKNLGNDFDRIKKDAVFNFGESVLNDVLNGKIQQNFWLLTVVQSIASLFKGTISAYKSYDQKKYQLRKNPLFIFLNKD
ncbi:MAG: hypothetical protein HQ537_01795 [Parcubacteria group bacterium]|nr:hypothetical protein [Parcubacteria group bacterium]